MINNMLDIINVAQLEVLGFKREYRYIVIIFISVLVICIALKPFITLLSNKQHTFVLTYIISSLLLIVVTSMITHVNSDFVLIKTVLQTNVIFGVTFVLYIFYKILKKKSV